MFNYLISTIPSAYLEDPKYKDLLWSGGSEIMAETHDIQDKFKTFQDLENSLFAQRYKDLSALADRILFLITDEN